MEICVARANQSILRAAQADPQCNGMGTTLVVAVFQGHCLTLGHIGDSRCYRLRGGALARITRDHSLLQEQLDAGLLTPRQAAVATHRNLVTRALGVEEAVQLEVAEHRVEPGDCYLLCSDGLSDMVDDAALAAVLARPASLAECASELVRQANANGGRDNISVLLARAGRARRRSLWPRWWRGAGTAR